MANSEDSVSIPVHHGGFALPNYRQSPPKSAPFFSIRDNTRFQSTPNLNSTTSYNTNVQSAEVSGGYLATPEVTYRRSPSPRRLILKGGGSSIVQQNGFTSTQQPWRQQVPSTQQYQQIPVEHKPPSASAYSIDNSGSNLYQQPLQAQLQNFTQVNSYSTSPQQTTAYGNVNPQETVAYNDTNRTPFYQQPNSNGDYSYLPTHYSTVTHSDSPRQTYHNQPQVQNAGINHFSVQNGYSGVAGSSEERLDLTSDESASSAPVPNNSTGESSEEQANIADQMPPLAPPLPGPPPPPPIPEGGIPAPPRPTEAPQAMNMSGLAEALQSAKLKKVDTSGIPPPLVGAKAVLMEEMQRKLARRRARADGEESPSNNCSIRSSPIHTTLRSNTSSPKPVKPVARYPDSQLSDNPQIGSGSRPSQESLLTPELQQLKQELLSELRHDLHQLRADILAAIRGEKPNTAMTFDIPGV